MIDYINSNRHLLDGRPQCYQHGDYHIGNMIIDSVGRLTIIDFNRNDFGDPWEEFNRIVWCAQKSPLFASGMVNGYFNGNVPMEFWQLLALYIASNMLSSIYWAIPFGQTEINTMLNQAKEVLEWYHNMQNPVPTWYFEGYYLQYADGLPYKLKAPFDFSFLSHYGTIFKIFDDQDSGNICFGTEKDGKRYFIKYAGVPTEQYAGNPEDAVARLKATLPVYQTLRHSNLIKFVRAEEIGGGYAVVFRWANGECMGRMYPASRQKFMQIDTKTKLKVFHDILAFFKDVTSQGYVAIDFYDGSILYDFEGKNTTICDIDFFRRIPCTNDMEFAGLTGTERVIDAYCGIGTIGLIASRQAKEVIGVELNRDAVRDAIANCRLNQIPNARFYTADAGEWMLAMAQENFCADVVFMDPPRAGSDECFLRSLLTLAPRKVIYISCNPETLARDLKILTETVYRTEVIQPVDMFPHTHHVETVTFLEKLV